MHVTGCIRLPAGRNRAPHREALVIGISAYTHMPVVRQAVADAQVWHTASESMAHASTRQITTIGCIHSAPKIVLYVHTHYF